MTQSGTVSSTNAGTYTTTWTLLNSSINWTTTPVATLEYSLTWTINKAVLTISGNPISVTFGASQVTPTRTVSGLKGSDAASLVTG
jgi:hypothetical protein